MNKLTYNEPAERFAPIVEKSLCAGASAVMVPSETGCWVHYAEYCERIANLKSEADKVIADLEETHKKEVEQLLIEIVKLKRERRWRKLSEELPTAKDANESGKLLGYLGGFKIAHEYHWTDVLDKPYGLTHWMPMPKAPEEALK